MIPVTPVITVAVRRLAMVTGRRRRRTTRRRRRALGMAPLAAAVALLSLMASIGEFPDQARTGKLRQPGVVLGDHLPTIATTARRTAGVGVILPAARRVRVVQVRSLPSRTLMPQGRERPLPNDAAATVKRRGTTPTRTAGGEVLAPGTGEASTRRRRRRMGWCRGAVGCGGEKDVPPDRGVGGMGTAIERKTRRRTGGRAAHEAVETARVVMAGATSVMAMAVTAHLVTAETRTAGTADAVAPTETTLKKTTTTSIAGTGAGPTGPSPRPPV